MFQSFYDQNNMTPRILDSMATLKCYIQTNSTLDTLQQNCHTVNYFPIL